MSLKDSKKLLTAEEFSRIRKMSTRAKYCINKKFSKKDLKTFGDWEEILKKENII
jgi:hypothetical protein